MENANSTATGRLWRRLTPDRMREWATTVAERVEVDRVIEAISVSGPCPTCGCDFEVVLTEKDILAGLAGDRRIVLKGPGRDGSVDWQGQIRFLAFCYCEGAHQGRPSDTNHGCGAAGFIRDEP